jgi:Na+/phosphate symporter
MNSERISTNSKMKLRRLQKKKEVFEIKNTTQDMKEEYNKDMESLRKKNQTEILELKSPLNQLKSTVERYSIKCHLLANWIKKEHLTICCLQETHLADRNKHFLSVKR